MRFMQKKVLPSLLPTVVVALVLAGAVFLGVWATQASSWPGEATTTAAPTTTTTAPTTTTVEPTTTTLTVTTTVPGPELDTSAVPLPPSLKSLYTIEAEPWVKIDDSAQTFLEGPAFDRDGNLYLTSMWEGRVIKVTPDKQVSTVFANPDLITDGLAIHRDGRIFIACLTGQVVSINADGSNLTYYDAKYEGRPTSCNDLFFDMNGNLYVTDWTGTIEEATGGVYRYSSDFKEVRPVLVNLASPNGVALDTAQNVLWISETCMNQIIRVELLEDGISHNPVAGVTIPYRFTGAPGGCDSNAIDSAGNIYQCLIFQGRVEVLSKNGIPLANIIIPGREKGLHLGTTNIAFRPGTDELYLTVWGEGGAWIYTARGLAEGAVLYSHK
ncbi:MAG: SMP-30/gluconolactonase/LRE family protein [Actinomycetia bacterium]|nr:SMP-30/gluconolactonase/LRE family protein [Actinomycetes bacterium]